MQRQRREGDALNRPRALLFDGDGVVLTAPPFTRALARTYGIDPTPLQPFFRTAFPACLEGAAAIEDAIAPYLAACGWKAGVEALLEFWFRAEHQVDDDLLGLIDGYRRAGLRCYLATNEERRRAAYIAMTMGMAGRFDGLFFSCELGARKPAAPFFDALAAALAPIRPSEMLLWDDAVANVEAARAAGMVAEFYTGRDSFARVMRR